MLRFLTSVFLLAVFCGAEASASVTWVDRTGAPVSEAEVAAAAGRADYVLLGEVHDNPDHHAAQARILEVMLRAGRRPALVWEMVRRDQADALAAAGDPDAFAGNLDWANSGWPSYGMYRPLVALAYAFELSQIAGNLSRETLRDVSRQGLAALTAAERDAWGLASDPGEAVRGPQLDAVFVGHCELIARDRLTSLVDSQLARDGALAGAMVAGDGDGAVLIAGSGHTRDDIGVPVYLKRLDPDAVVLSIGQRETADGAAGEAGSYDFTAFAPAIDRPDPCDRMRQFLEARKKSG
ncbi:MAG: ChaN family lipoprotein [Alphaproteobacteria bacterium]|nr:ChaN family lipoprotein [Alphaproteobacteria bacterium]